MSRQTKIYWLATALFCGVFLFGGASHLFRSEQIAESMARLGYPAYVMTILGVAKLLGVAALLAPAMPLVKEWAYAGFSFDLLGAVASHGFAGDPFLEMLPPVAILALGAVSYLLRPASRRIRPAASYVEAT